MCLSWCVRAGASLGDFKSVSGSGPRATATGLSSLPNNKLQCRDGHRPACRAIGADAAERPAGAASPRPPPSALPRCRQRRPASGVPWAFKAGFKAGIGEILRYTRYLAAAPPESICGLRRRGFRAARDADRVASASGERPGPPAPAGHPRARFAVRQRRGRPSPGSCRRPGPCLSRRMG